MDWWFESVFVRVCIWENGGWIWGLKRPHPQNQFSPYVVGCMWWWLIVLLIMTDGMLLLDGTLPAMNCGMLYLPCTIGVLYAAKCSFERKKRNPTFSIALHQYKRTNEQEHNEVQIHVLFHWSAVQAVSVFRGVVWKVSFQSWHKFLAGGVLLVDAMRWRSYVMHIFHVLFHFHSWLLCATCNFIWQLYVMHWK